MTVDKVPPLGVRLTVDVQERPGKRGTTYYARVRWTHPPTHHREGLKRTFNSLRRRSSGSTSCRTRRGLELMLANH